MKLVQKTVSLHPEHWKTIEKMANKADISLSRMSAKILTEAAIKDAGLLRKKMPPLTDEERRCFDEMYAEEEKRDV